MNKPPGDRGGIKCCVSPRFTCPRAAMIPTERSGYARSRRVACGTRSTSCSHSLFERGNYRQFSTTVAHFGLCSVQFSSFALTSFIVLSIRGSSDGGSSVDSVTGRWRWAWGVTTLWLARPPLMLTLLKVSEPLLQWRKVQMDSGVLLWVSRTFFACLGLPVKPLDDGILESDRVWIFRLT